MERTAEIVVLIALAWPLLRLSVEPAFLRNVATIRSRAIAIAALLILYLVAIAVAALSAPALLRGLAVVAGCVMVGLAWRARSSHGQSRGWPPGSLALAPLGPWRDQLFYAKQAARFGPIFKTSNVIEPVVCIVGFDHARELLRSHGDSLTMPPLPFNRFIPRGFLRYMSASDHLVYRRIFRNGFSRSVIEQCEPFIAETLRRELRRMADDRHRARGSGVRPERRINEMLFIVFVRLFFGVLPNTACFAELQTIYRLTDFRRAWRTRPRTVERALERVACLLDELTIRNSRLDQQSGEATESVLAAIVRSDPEAARNPTVIANLIYIMQTAWKDVSGLMNWVLKMLIDHPEWIQRVRDEPALVGLAQGDGERSISLPSRIVMETLRLEQSEYLIRRTTAKIELGGFVIPKGWLVRICVHESHRSPAVFDEPDTFNPDRFLNDALSRSDYSPFGLSKGKACLGEEITIVIGRIFTQEVACGFDWRVLADGAPEFGGFHWKPSSKLKVHLTPKTDSGTRRHASEPVALQHH